MPYLHRLLLKAAIPFAVLALFLPSASLLAQEELTITSVSPASGPSAGGTLITITGTGFTDLCNILCSPHGVLFGDVPATDLTIVDRTTIKVLTPPHAPGRIDVVRLQTLGFETRLGGAFTYIDSPPLMLQDGRFRVEVSALNPRDGRVASGNPIPYNDKFGFFNFPELTNDPANPEVFVKIVGPIEGKHLLFYGGLTDFEYTLTVGDTMTGLHKSYVKPAGEFRGDLLP